MFTPKRSIGLLALIVVCASIFGGQTLLFPEIAHAQATVTNTTDVVQWFNTIVSVSVEFLSVVAWLSLSFLSFLLNPDVIEAVNQTAVRGGSPLLLEIWRLSRDIMNVLFAFMLVIAALYTVVTAKRDVIEEHIVKFILAVVLVNFSWFFPRVILDVANVLTATIFSLPSSVGAECLTLDDQGNQVPCKFARRIYFDFNGTNTDMPAACRSGAVTGGALSNPSSATFITPIPQVCLEIAPLPPEADTGLSMLHGLYMNHIRLMNVTKLIPAGPAAQVSQTRELLNFIMQLLFVALYLLGATLPLAAMVVVFAVRIPIIWLTTAFMPFMFLGFVLQEKINQLFDPMSIFKHFTKAAFLPTVVAIPLAVGYIMIGAATQIPCPDNPAFADLCSDQGVILDGITSLWDLLWSGMAIAIMWVGFFMVLKIDDVYMQIGEKFKSFGQTWGSFLLKSPLALPLPMGSDNVKMSPLQWAKALSRPEASFMPGGKLDLDFSSLKDRMGAPITATDKDRLRDVVDSIKPGSTTNTHIQNFIKSGGNIKDVKDFLRSERVTLDINTTRAFLREFDTSLKDADLDRLAPQIAEP